MDVRYRLTFLPNQSRFPLHKLWFRDSRSGCSVSLYPPSLYIGHLHGAILANAVAEPKANCIDYLCPLGCIPGERRPGGWPTLELAARSLSGRSRRALRRTGGDTSSAMGI